MPNGRPWTKELLLEKLTETASGCWEWSGYRDSNGYGDTYYLGKKDRTHRVAWQLFVGPLMRGDFVLHRCDNPPCCNPQHLFLGSQTENMRDCVSKGRFRFVPPERRFLAVGKDVPISDILSRRGRGESMRSVAKALGIPFTTVWRVSHGTHWQQR